MEKITFCIVGGGWRAEFYLRIAHALPEQFDIAGVVVRDPEKAKKFSERWGCPVYGDIESMLAKSTPLFVVTSVPWAANPVICKTLVDHGVCVLSETPPAPDLNQMIDLFAHVEEKKGRVQVAEQYFLQPHHAARLEIIKRGYLGEISQAQMSCAHGYHGISLIRKTLGVGFEPPKVSTRIFTAPLIEGTGRRGEVPARETQKKSTQRFYWFDFGAKLGILDFASDQYFSWIRNHRILIRGERGEIIDNAVSFLKDFRTPVFVDLRRRATGIEGNLEGCHLNNILFGNEIVYSNPTVPARLSDDEIAICDLLYKMAVYVRGGEEVYPLAEACQDHYLNLLFDESLKSNTPIKAQPQVWADHGQ